jgi:hypothetical protein
MWPGFTYSMPIPENLFDHPDRYTDKRFLSQGNVKLVWCLWPRRCQVSRQWMWFTLAYRAQYIVTGPGDPCVWTRWYSNEEMIILKLKGY